MPRNFAHRPGGPAASPAAGTKATDRCAQLATLVRAAGEAAGPPEFHAKTLKAQNSRPSRASSWIQWRAGGLAGRGYKSPVQLSPPLR